MQHILNQKSNVILQKAFTKYGLASFRFLVFEYISLEEGTAENLSMLLATEQLYIDSFKPRYNINPTAGSSLGYKHTKETLAKMRGVNNPAYGRTGDKNPMWGRTGNKHPM